MAKSLIEFNQKESIMSAPLPVYNNTRSNGVLSYTVIPHSSIINTAEESFKNNNLIINKEAFVNTFNSQVVYGEYQLDYSKDSGFCMSYSFTNSYNKQVRFETAVGVKLLINDTVIINKLNDWKRKHTGDADIEAQNTISEQIAYAKEDYKMVIDDLNYFKSVMITKLQYCHLIGRLFGQNILSSSQLNIVHEQFKKPSFDYNNPAKDEETGKYSLYNIYLNVCYSLREDHPVTKLQNLAKAHDCVMCFALEIKPREVELTKMLDTPNLEGSDFDIDAPIQAVEETAEQPIVETAEEQVQPTEQVQSEEDELEAIRKEYQQQLIDFDQELPMINENEQEVEDINVEESTEEVTTEETEEEPIDDTAEQMVEFMSLEEQERIKNDMAREDFERENHIEPVSEENFVEQEEEYQYFSTDDFPYAKGDSFDVCGKTLTVVDVIDNILVCK